MWTDEQQAVIGHVPQNTVVFAAPGSGKTSVLIQHIGYQLRSGLHPNQIMAMTFTRQSGNDMKHRLRQLLGGSLQSETLRMGTMHAQCFRVLLRECPDVPVLLRPHEAFLLMKQAILVTEKALFVRRESVHRMLLLRAKVESFIDLASVNRLNRVMKTYDDLKRKYHRWDFEDILISFFKRLRDAVTLPEILKDIRYLLIDEFQDTNQLQWRILREFQRFDVPIFVVGDDDQSIYGFRGASPKWLLQFADYTPGTRVHHLSTNFRSDQSIVHHANSLIVKNASRSIKTFATSSSELGHVSCWAWRDERAEGLALTERVARLCREKRTWSIAILARTRNQLLHIWRILGQFTNISLHTFHAAKGKEWDAVFIAGSVDDNPYLNHDDLNTRWDETEERRLFYVAMTRAKHHLEIHYSMKMRAQRTRASRFISEAEIEVMRVSK